ncbi:MAG: hypothetical protein HYZ71_14450 [Deltaproteobacteria bacterium]|nr:hypothetical protein [Deltaproteobacteria bacterium]
MTLHLSRVNEFLETIRKFARASPATQGHKNKREGVVISLFRHREVELKKGPEKEAVVSHPEFLDDTDYLDADFEHAWRPTEPLLR